MTHSKEPWRHGKNGDSVVCDKGANTLKGADDVKYYGGHLIAESVGAVDQRRIIACVNILAGVPTETLEYVASVGLRVSVTCDPYVPAPGAAPRVNCALNARLEPTL